MAGGATGRLFFFCSFLWFLAASCSGTLVGFSFDARGEGQATSATLEAVSFLKRNKLLHSQIRVFVADQSFLLNPLANTGFSVDLYVNLHEVKELLSSEASAISWIKTHLMRNLPRINITSIVLHGSSKPQLPLLLPILSSVNSALKTLGLEQRMKVGASFALFELETLYGNNWENLQEIMSSIRRSTSFIVVEDLADGYLSMGDHFVQAIIRRANYVCTFLPYADTPMVFNFKSSVVPSGIEIAQFPEKLLNSFASYGLTKNRVLGLFIEIGKSEQRELGREEEQIFPSSHRELLNHFSKPFSASKITRHDILAPINDPFTTPLAVPTTNPTPGIVTVPATNPVNVLPTNPTTTPVTVPATNPGTQTTIPGTNPTTPPANPTIPPANPATPISIPSTNPAMPPPAVPVTNPVTTPSTVPVTPPMTSPITTNPFPPPSSIPTTPSTVPISPALSGQSWCVAKTGALDTALQLALDYACGIGGADCTAIQQTGSCYNPNTLRDHASYAFNSYYQKNPSPTSCDFGGTATVVSINPSSTTCKYPTSSSSSSVSNPASSAGSTTTCTGIGGSTTTTCTGTGGSTTTTGAGGSTTTTGAGGPTTTFGGSTTTFGSTNPVGSDNSTSTGNSVSLSASLPLLLAISAVFSNSWYT